MRIILLLQLIFWRLHRMFVQAELNLFHTHSHPNTHTERRWPSLLLSSSGPLHPLTHTFIQSHTHKTGSQLSNRLTETHRHWTCLLNFKHLFVFLCCWWVKQDFKSHKSGSNCLLSCGMSNTRHGSSQWQPISINTNNNKNITYGKCNSIFKACPIVETVVRDQQNGKEFRWLTLKPRS